MSVDLIEAMLLPSLVLLLLMAATLERLASRIGWMPWRKRREKGSWSGMPFSSAGFEEFETFFRGSKQHERNFKQFSLMHREEEGDGAPPRSHVDLDTNTAHIVIRRRVGDR
jgi:hypothetical protein